METDAFDEDDIRKAIQLILAPGWAIGDVAELRALSTAKGTVSGYFDADHSDELVAFASHWSGRSLGVYVTLNPVIPDLLARAANRTVPYAKHTTGDAEISCRHWLLLDTDPQRPSGISATDDEHEFALERAREIRDFLREQGWSDPILADSGNGGHLLYRIELPVDDGELVKRVLHAVAKKFDDERVEVDVTVHNASRISKLYGTMACKGDSVPKRPHRLARILEVPPEIIVTSRNNLETIIPESPPPSPAKSITAYQTDSDGPTDVVAYLQAHDIEVGKSKPFGGGTLWELKRCPWRPTEKDGGPFVIQFPGGVIEAGCKHKKCDGKGWPELRDVVEPGWRKTAPKGAGNKRASAAEAIVRIAESDEFFHTSDGDAFASILVAGRRETYRIDGHSYGQILRGRLYETGSIISKSALDDAIATLKAKAIFSCPEQKVFVRTAEHDGRLYLDLCNDRWEAVEISADGWKIVTDFPIRFVRYPGMLPLPKPTLGGSVDELREIINATDEDWLLIVAWLMAALRPTGPFPILHVNGEHGSCKSTNCRWIRTVVDPNATPLRDAPRDGRTLMIWARNSHVVAIDNLSLLSKDISNAMCRLATGGGHSERKNYTDDVEMLFQAVRPQIVNGIGNFITRSDFLDRSLSVSLPVIPKKKRKSEKKLDARMVEIHPRVLGALLSAASQGIARLPEVEQMELELPRLADFAMWMIAVEDGLGWKEGTFMRVIGRNERDAHEAGIENSSVAQAILKFMENKKQFSATSTKLWSALNENISEQNKRQDDWPKNSQVLSSKLRECAPNLRAFGVDVVFRDKDRPKVVVLTNVVGPAAGQLASEGQFVSYGNEADDPVEGLLRQMVRVWTANVASVALPSQIKQRRDGA